MAYAPCSLCLRRYTGKASSFYPAVAAGRDFLRCKLRLCPPCAAHFLADRMRNFRRVDPDDSLRFLLADSCASCAAEVQGDANAAFVTVYLPGEERVDYFALAHGACAAELARQLCVT